MTFNQASHYLFQGHPIARDFWTKSQSLSFNHYGLLIRGDGKKVKLFDEDFKANDWVVYDLPKKEKGTSNDIR